MGLATGCRASGSTVPIILDVLKHMDYRHISAPHTLISHFSLADMLSDMCAERGVECLLATVAPRISGYHVAGHHRRGRAPLQPASSSLGCATRARPLPPRSGSPRLRRHIREYPHTSPPRPPGHWGLPWSQQNKEGGGLPCR